MPLPLRIVWRYLLTIFLLWILARVLPNTLTIGGGAWALPTLAAVLLLLNTVLRPALSIIALPLKLFVTLLAVILVNAVFLWILQTVVAHLDPTIATLTIDGGTLGWIIVALSLGIGNWLIQKLS